jgi:hypothetical protein
MFVGVLPMVWPQLASAGADDALLSRLKRQYLQYVEQHQDPATGLLYMATVKALKNEKRYAPENARQGMVDGVPSPHGYGTKGGDSGMSDTSLFGGQLLYSLLEAYDARKDRDLERWARHLFQGLKIIGSASPVPGFIVRGPHPLDRKAYYRDSSMDQHSTYVIALWRYYHSPLATEDDRAFIRDSLDKVARRLEKNQWRILWEDDSREAHAGGGNLTRFGSEAITLLMPMVGAAADVTHNAHWQETYRRFAAERDGLRWQVLMPDHRGFEMNAHLLWGQQALFRLHCWYGFEKDPSRRKAFLANAEGYTVRRMAHSFPPQTGRGALFELFRQQTLTTDEAKRLGWKRGYCEGPFEAWEHYPEDQKSLPASLKAKLRDICVLYPSSALTMALYSRNPSLEARSLPLALDMVNRVDLTSLPGWPRWAVIVLGWKAYAVRSASR